MKLNKRQLRKVLLKALLNEIVRAPGQNSTVRAFFSNSVGSGYTGTRTVANSALKSYLSANPNVTVTSVLPGSPESEGFLKQTESLSTTGEIGEKIIGSALGAAVVNTNSFTSKAFKGIVDFATSEQDVTSNIADIKPNQFPAVDVLLKTGGAQGKLDISDAFTLTTARPITTTPTSYAQAQDQYETDFDQYKINLAQWENLPKATKKITPKPTGMPSPLSGTRPADDLSILGTIYPPDAPVIDKTYIRNLRKSLKDYKTNPSALQAQMSSASAAYAAAQSQYVTSYEDYIDDLSQFIEDEYAHEQAMKAYNQKLQAYIIQAQEYNNLSPAEQAKKQQPIAPIQPQPLRAKPTPPTKPSDAAFKSASQEYENIGIESAKEQFKAGVLKMPNNVRIASAKEGIGAGAYNTDKGTANTFAFKEHGINKETKTTAAILSIAAHYMFNQDNTFNIAAQKNVICQELLDRGINRIDVNVSGIQFMIDPNVDINDANGGIYAIIVETKVEKVELIIEHSSPDQNGNVTYSSTKLRNPHMNRSFRGAGDHPTLHRVYDFGSVNTIRTTVTQTQDPTSIINLMKFIRKTSIAGSTGVAYSNKALSFIAFTSNLIGLKEIYDVLMEQERQAANAQQALALEALEAQIRANFTTWKNALVVVQGLIVQLQKLDDTFFANTVTTNSHYKQQGTRKFKELGQIIQNRLEDQSLVVNDILDEIAEKSVEILETLNSENANYIKSTTKNPSVLADLTIPIANGIPEQIKQFAAALRTTAGLANNDVFVNEIKTYPLNILQEVDRILNKVLPPQASTAATGQTAATPGTGSGGPTNEAKRSRYSLKSLLAEFKETVPVVSLNQPDIIDEQMTNGAVSLRLISEKIIKGISNIFELTNEIIDDIFESLTIILKNKKGIKVNESNYSLLDLIVDYVDEDVLNESSDYAWDMYMQDTLDIEQSKRENKNDTLQRESHASLLRKRYGRY